MSSGSPLSAIVRIDGTSGWGTGFVVAAKNGEPLILTARHVAEDGSLKMMLTDGVSSDAVLHRRGQADWALIRCTDPAVLRALAQIAPIALDSLEGPPDTPFDTFGYPNLYGSNGGSLHGTVRRIPSGIEPYCVELNGLLTEQAKGVSGAPCLVADVAVGLIHSTLGHVGNIIAGTLQVVLAETIVAESDGLLGLDTDRTLPYLPLVSWPLATVDKDNLLAMAEKLKLPIVAGQQPEVLRRRVARGLLVAKPEQVARALVSRLEIDPIKAAAVKLLVYRETLWLRAAVVAALLDIVERGGAVALDTTLEITIRHMLRRASWCRGGEERWYNRQHCLMVVPEVPTVDAVVQAVAMSARTQLTADSAKFKQVLLNRRVIAVLHKVVPRPEISSALAKEYPELRVIFLSLPQATDANAPSIRWLLPALQPGEGPWREECNEARRVLSNGFGREIPNEEFDLLM